MSISNKLSEGSSANAMLCCDSNGQSIGFKGRIDPNQSGTFTSMMRLANQLDGYSGSSTAIVSPRNALGNGSRSGDNNSSLKKGMGDLNTIVESSDTESNVGLEKGISGTHSNNSNSGGNGNNSKLRVKPCITIETDQSITLIKSYYGDHTVITKLPNSSINNNSGVEAGENVNNDGNELVDGQSQSRPASSIGGGVIGVIDEDSNKMDGSEFSQT